MVAEVEAAAVDEEGTQTQSRRPQAVCGRDGAFAMAVHLGSDLVQLQRRRPVLRLREQHV